jgi:MerR family mercuric resistance operon transcriptional regulator
MAGDIDDDPSSSGLSISELARRADVGNQTVRYYERRGLLPEPPRNAAGPRRYD